jgi:hypothetical protein
VTRILFVLCCEWCIAGCLCVKIIAGEAWLYPSVVGPRVLSFRGLNWSPEVVSRTRPSSVR